MIKNTVAIYCRLSDEDRDKLGETDDSRSIQNQKNLLQLYALEQGWNIHRIYSDDNYAGADRSRPEFNHLLEDAERGKFDIILCKSQSRFTRELELVEKYINGLFPVWGIRFVSVADHADTANKGNKKSRQINGLVNEWYLEDMSENIKVVLTNRRKNGYHIGSFALYGYIKDPKQKGHLIIDEEAAAVVREVFTLFSKGWGKTAIARMLNDKNIPNPTEYKRLHGFRYHQPKQKNAALWKYFSIANMLTNEVYIGNMVQGKYGSVSYKTKQNRPLPKEQWYRVEGTHEAIIDRDLWDRVQALIAQRSKPFITGEIGLFARKARCVYCGYTMRSSKTSKGLHYLQCSNRHVAKEACPGAFISVNRLEQYVLTEFKRLVDIYLDKNTAIEKIELRNNFRERHKQLQTKLGHLHRQMDEIKIGLKNLYLDKVKGIITDEMFVALSKDFSETKLHIENKISVCQKQITEIVNNCYDAVTPQQIFTRYMNLTHLNREMVEKLIDYILVGRRIPGTREVPIEIHWNF